MSKLSKCCTCGYEWITGKDGSHSCVEHLKKDLVVTKKLLAERQLVLDSIPECEVHGRCVPHAIEWIEKAKRLEYELLLAKTA